MRQGMGVDLLLPIFDVAKNGKIDTCWALSLLWVLTLCAICRDRNRQLDCQSTKHQERPIDRRRGRRRSVSNCMCVTLFALCHRCAHACWENEPRETLPSILKQRRKPQRRARKGCLHEIQPRNNVRPWAPSSPRRLVLLTL